MDAASLSRSLAGLGGGGAAAMLDADDLGVEEADAAPESMLSNSTTGCCPPSAGMADAARGGGSADANSAGPHFLHATAENVIWEGCV